MAKQEKPATKRWTARLIRKKMEVLGIVYAADQDAARAGMGKGTEVGAARCSLGERPNLAAPRWKAR